MCADLYQALCFFAVILNMTIFAPTLESFGPQNISEKNKKTMSIPENAELSEQSYSFKYHVYP